MKVVLSIVSIASCAFLVAQGPGGPQLGRSGKKEELPAVLRDAQEKSKKLRFSGTRLVTFYRAGKAESHEEYLTKDGPNMRIEFAAGSPFAGQVIVETPEGRKHFFPDRNELRESPASGRKQFEILRFGGMRGGKPIISDGGTILGLKVSKVQYLDPMKNPAFEVYIDTKSGLAVKRVIYGPGGSVAGSFEFKTLNMNPTIAKGAFSFNRKGVKIIRPIDDLFAKAKELGVSPYGFSNNDGYKLDGVNLREMRGRKVLILNYSQNESRLTMFLLKPDADLQEIQKSSRRQQGFYAWKEAGASIVLIGDASQDELQNVAKRVSILGR
ncbi:MAG: hypothetical protein WCK51_14430 [Armatimonadota bacterium]